MRTSCYINWLAALAMCWALFSCEARTQQMAATAAASNKLCLSDSLQKLIGLDTVHIRQVKGELRLNGKLTLDQNKVASIFPLITGNVTEVKVELGDYVTTGQVLATVQSADIADLELRHQSAVANLAIAEKNLQTARELYQSKLGSERDFINAQQELEKARGELLKSSETLKLYGAQGGTQQVIKATSNGYIMTRNISEGTSIRANDDKPLFVISNLDDIWLLANVYESDIEKISMGLPVTVTTLSYPDKLFTGVIDRVYNVIDPDTRSMRVRVKLKNENLLLKPEMFATVLVSYPEARQLPAVSAQALIFDNNRYYVVVYNGPCDYKAREVQLFKNSTTTAFLSAGLNPGERVINRRQLLAFESLNN